MSLVLVVLFLRYLEQRDASSLDGSATGSAAALQAPIGSDRISRANTTIRLAAL